MTIEKRNLLRTAIASVTSILLAKGMSISAHDGEILWTITFAIMTCFWAIGMWEWNEADV